jgi:hypothetical protein
MYELVVSSVPDLTGTIETTHVENADSIKILECTELASFVALNASRQVARLGPRKAGRRSKSASCRSNFKGQRSELIISKLAQSYTTCLHSCSELHLRSATSSRPCVTGGLWQKAEGLQNTRRSPRVNSLSMGTLVSSGARAVSSHRTQLAACSSLAFDQLQCSNSSIVSQLLLSSSGSRTVHYGSPTRLRLPGFKI